MKKLLFVFFCLSFLTSHSFGQCSDAGICSLSNHTNVVLASNSIKLGYSFGTTGKDEKLNHQKISLDYTHYFMEGASSLAISIPYSIQSGENVYINEPSVRVSGIGDIQLLGSMSVWNDEVMDTSSSIHAINTMKSLQVQVGAKFATGKINEDNLPLRYQSGLGTNDLLLGISYIMSPFEAGIGFQLPFGISKNHIDSLKRGADLLTHISFTHTFDRFSAIAEILAIKRLSKSKLLFPPGTVLITEESPDPIVLENGEYVIKESDQFQLNLRGTVEYRLQNDITFEAGFAIPFIKRSDNTDGLKRAFTISGGVKYLF